VAGFDMTLMVPVLGVGGVLLWRRHPWGYVVAPLAGIQAMLYLFVLAVNAGVLAARGLGETPGELPIWGTLFAFTSFATMVLLSLARDESAPGERNVAA